jgi:plasmid replication initiation protein
VVLHPNIYVKLNLVILRGLNSKHSVALYEFMKDYQNLGKYRCEVGEFRRLMGIKPEQYSIFSMLKKRVLDTAVEEINEKTDILIAYELERMGRKITSIVLKVTAKKKEYH